MIRIVGCPGRMASELVGVREPSRKTGMARVGREHAGNPITYITSFRRVSYQREMPKPICILPLTCTQSSHVGRHPTWALLISHSRPLHLGLALGAYRTQNLT